jgi:hypothetical protein
MTSVIVKLVVVNSLLLFSGCHQRFHSSIKNGPADTRTFAQSSDTCPNMRLMVRPGSRPSALTINRSELKTWDIASGKNIQASRMDDVRNASQALLLNDPSLALVAGDMGICLVSTSSGAILRTFDYEFAIRNLIYYTVGASKDNRLGAASGLTSWPHHIPDVTGYPDDKGASIVLV